MTEKKHASFKLAPEELDQALRSWSQGMDVFAPRRLRDRNRMAGQDIIRYGPVSAGEDIEWQQKSDFSAKVVLFPPNETLFHLVGDTIAEPSAVASQRPLLVFCRACDIHGVDQAFVADVVISDDDDIVPCRVDDTPGLSPTVLRAKAMRLATEHHIKAIFVENMALAFFLGMCSFLAVSKKVETAIGLGFASGKKTSNRPSSPNTRHTRKKPDSCAATSPLSKRCSVRNDTPASFARSLCVIS